MKRYIIISYFSNGSGELHLIFDNPGRLKAMPKYFEQKRRDQLSPVVPGHECENVKAITRLPKNGEKTSLTAESVKDTSCVF